MKAMSDESRAEKFLELFSKGKEFTEELLRENQRLRYRMAATETESPMIIRKLEQKVSELTDENQRMLQRFREVEEENKDFANRYLEVEAQNSNLANLYVASYQLHSTLDFREVVQIVQEIIINLIGAEAFSLLLHDDETGLLKPIVSEGADCIPGLNTISVRPGVGNLGQIIESGTAYYNGSGSESDVTLDKPLAAVPLKIKDHTIGLLAIYKLLRHKDSFSAMDYELFSLLAAHAATAIFASKLYWHSERKLNTIQSFLDLLTTN